MNDKLSENKSLQTLFQAFIGLVVVISSILTFGFFYEFLPNFLPVELVGEEISKFASGLFGLLVFDLGSLMWLYVYLKLCDNASQRTTAIFASVVDFAGSLITSFTYLIITGQKLLNLEDSIRSTVGFVSLISIAAVMVYNFLSIWIYKKNSDESIRDIAEGKRKQRLADVYEVRKKALDSDVEKLVRQRFNDRKSEIADMIADRIVQDKIEEELGRSGIGTDGMFSVDTRQQSPKL